MAIGVCTCTPIVILKVFLYQTSADERSFVSKSFALSLKFPNFALSVTLLSVLRTAGEMENTFIDYPK